MRCEFSNSFKFDLFFKIFIFIFAAVLRIICINDKYGMHEDEVMSFAISNYSDFWHKDLAPQQDFNGKDLAKAVFFHDATFSSAWCDVKKLWRDNRDRPHTNLYYTCLRLWMTPISSSNFTDSMRHAVWLNFIFFIFSFFILLGILRETQLNTVTQNCLLISIFFNRISVSSVAFIRPYALQETLLLLFSYVFIKLWNKSQLNTIKDFTILSGYFATIYILILVGFLIYQRPLNSLFISGAFLCSILLARLLFCGYFYGFSCGRAGESFHNFSPKTLFGNFCSTLPIYEDLFYSLLSWIPLIFIAASVCWREKIRREIFIISGSAFLIGAFITFISPLKHIRYAMPFLPMINFAVFLAVKFLMDIFPKVKYVFSCKFKIIYLAALAIGLTNYKTDLFSFKEQKQIRKILCKPIPTFIFMEESWYVNRVLHLFNDSKTYCLITSMELLHRKLELENEAIVVTPYGKKIDFSEKFNINISDLYYENLGPDNFLRIYKISKKSLSR